MEKNEFIKKSDLKLWQVFVNNNNHLSIVHAITENNYYIYNYNGSNYSINRQDTSLTDYKNSNISPDDFFENYPMSIRNKWKKEPEYQSIKNRYLKSRYLRGGITKLNIETNSNYKLLLIL